MLAGSGSSLTVSGEICASSHFLTCKDDKVAADLRIVSGDHFLFGGMLPLCWRVVKLCTAATACVALLAALSAYAAARPFDLLHI